VGARKKSEGRSVVVLGTFNPAIITAPWLALEGLVSKSALERSPLEGPSLEVAHPDLSKFHVGYLNYLVQRDRLQIDSSDSRGFPDVPLKAIAILELLRHTPVQHVGLNIEFHAEFESTQERDQFGESLAPKARWNTLVTDPKLFSLVMHCDRSENKVTRVTIAPSETLPETGVKISVNDHHELVGGTAAATALMSQATASYARSITIAQEIVRWLP
jgi:hypothetical protein